MKEKCEQSIFIGTAAGTLAVITDIANEIFLSERSGCRRNGIPEGSVESECVAHAQNEYISQCAKLIRKSTGETYLFFGSINIGRAGYNDICLSGIYVSRNHCRIFADRGRYFITDLNAKCKAELNGSPVDNYNGNPFAYPLNNGDKIRIESEDFDFFAPDHSSASVASVAAAVTLS